MTTGNTTLLGLALPVDGELDGTWGDVVNDSITSLVDSAVAGTTTLPTDADVTLTDTVLASNQARQAVLLWTASNGATTRNITAPARSKPYIVINAGTGSIVLRGAGPTTGVTILSGEKCLAAWNGSDFVKISGSSGDVSVRNLTVTGNLSVEGNSTLGNASGDAVTINGNANFANVNPTLTAGTANGVAYLNGSKVLTTGSTLTFDGTYLTANGLRLAGADATNTIYQATGTLGISTGSASGITFATNLTTRYSIDATGVAVWSVGGSEQMRLTSTGLGIGNSSPTAKLDVTGTAAISGAVTLSGGTANGVAYLNGSKVLTTGSALTFDGSLLKLGSGAALSVQGIAFPASGSGAEIFWDGSESIVQSYNRTSSAYVPLWLESSYTRFGINGSEAMRLTSTGLGIGTSSPGAKLHVSTGTTTNAIAGNAVAGFTSSANAVISFNVPDANSAGLFFGYGGNPYWAGIEKDGGNGLKLTAAGNTLIYNSSGNLGLGVTPSAWNSTWRASEIQRAGNAVTSNAVNSIGLSSNAYFDSVGWKYGANGTANFMAVGNGGGQFAWFTAPSGTAGNNISFTQAMTLDASGNLLVGTTNDSTGQQGFAWLINSGGSFGRIYHANGTGTGTAYLAFQYDGGVIGTITQNGTSAVAYNTSSDYRLKNITGPITTSGAYIDSLNPVEGTWKADGSTFVGLIAHEVQEVSRTTVATGVKDGEEMQGMDYSSAEIIANLIAEVKSLRARVAALESI